MRVLLAALVLASVGCLPRPTPRAPVVHRAEPPPIKYPVAQVVTPDNATRLALDGGLHVEVTGMQHNNAGGYNTVTGIRGVAQNRTGKRLSMCVLSLQLLDGSGAVVATASAFMQHLEPEQRWSFQAPVVVPYGARFSEVRVSGVTAIPAELP